MKYPLTTLMSALLMVNTVYAATPVDLRHQPNQYLQQSFTAKELQGTSQSKLQRIRSDVDANQTTHTRLQQTFAGFPVWNAVAVVHTPHSNLKNNFNMNSNATMNGIVYEGLEKD